MNNLAKKATLLSIFGNIVLFILKIFAGFLYNSIAVISDAFNSLTDIVASFIVYFSVKIGATKADKEHPFGHHRAEPIAGLIVAIFTGILGFEVINVAFTRLVEGRLIVKGLIPVLVLLFTLVLKFCMFIYTNNIGKKLKSPAISASAVDNRNDVLVSLGALIGVSGANLGYNFLDPLMALVIGLWIIKAGYSIGAKNIKYLIGESCSEDLLKVIKEKALSVKGIKSIHDVKVHYVGVFLQIEVHITVDKSLTIYRAHTIGKNVRKELEKLEEVSRAFVHIDPV